MFAPTLMYIAAYCGFFELKPLLDTSFVIQLGENVTIPVPNLVNK